MAEDKKYYWLKLKKDFFKRHDIQIIESMDNGKDYILFYLKMLVESVDHEGHLRFNDTIPYNEKMLSTITNTNIDIVRSAMKVFTELNMMEILEDKTIYMSEVEKMLGTETYWAEQKRKQREKEAQNKIGQCPNNVQLLSNVSNQEIDKEIDKDIDKKVKKKKETDFDIIINSYTTNEELKNNIYEFIKMRKGIKAAITSTGLKRMLSQLDKLSNNDSEKMQILDKSIMNSWRGIFALKGDEIDNGQYQRGNAKQQYNSNNQSDKKYQVEIKQYDGYDTNGDMPI